MGCVPCANSISERNSIMKEVDDNPLINFKPLYYPQLVYKEKIDPQKPFLNPKQPLSTDLFI